MEIGVRVISTDTSLMWNLLFHFTFNHFMIIQPSQKEWMSSISLEIMYNMTELSLKDSITFAHTVNDFEEFCRTRNYGSFWI